ncbi:hypothetical protein J4526_01485 [Desulfurococcaceae archaeon MEX13E-LK6-19]|nr:hypothetical protein J4526_01485 [Desulfurococcaceae archaeon MEX13E-LK6-19]
MSEGLVLAKKAVLGYMFYYRTDRVSYRLLHDMLFIPSPIAGSLGLVSIYWHSFERDIRELSLQGYLEPLHNKESSRSKGVFRVTDKLLEEYGIGRDWIRAPFYPDREHHLRQVLGVPFLEILRWKIDYQKPFTKKPVAKVVA